MSRFQQEYTKVCPYCEEQFTANRINQKFCSSRCKYTFNNRLRKKREKEKAPVSIALNKNHSIVKELFQRYKGEKKISETRLVNMGFSFDYITQLGNIKGKGRGLGIYNFALYEMEAGYYIIDKVA